LPHLVYAEKHKNSKNAGHYDDHDNEKPNNFDANFHFFLPIPQMSVFP